jgi:hypothetical protein
MLLGVAVGSLAKARQAAIALSIALLAAPLMYWTSPLAAQTAQQVRALAEQAIRQLDLQTELLRQPEPFSFQFTLPPETIWLVVIIGVGVLLYAFRDMLPMLKAGASGGWGSDETAPAVVNSPSPGAALGTADDLAAHGRFVEAMHVLLLHALAEIRLRLDEQFADSMTSREILRSKQLPDALSRPLRDVVHRVEWTYFGEHPAARDDYLACRSSFSALVQALAGGAAA